MQTFAIIALMAEILYVPETVASELQDCAGIRIAQTLRTEETSNFPTHVPVDRLALLEEAFPYNYQGVPQQNSVPERCFDMLTQQTILETHVDKVKERWPHYFQHVVDLADSLPAMKQACRTSVIIPARGEGATLHHTLQQMLIDRRGSDAQPSQRRADGTIMDPEQYEVALLANGTDEQAIGETLMTAEAFRHDYAALGLNIHVLGAQLPRSIANVGMARKLLQDICILRAAQRGHQASPYYVLSEDADIQGYHAQSFSGLTDALDSNPDKIVSQLRIDRDTATLAEAPYALFTQRVGMLGSAILKSPSFAAAVNPQFHASLNRRQFRGGSSAIVATELVKAGGFPVAIGAEDLMLDDQLMVYNGRSVGDGFTLNTTFSKLLPHRIRHSPRRLLASYVTAMPAYHNVFDRDNQLTRLLSRPLADIVALAQSKPIEAARAQVTAGISRQIEYLQRTAPSPEEAARYGTRLLTFAGFQKADYAISDGGQITISNWTHAEGMLDDYISRLHT
jgi:hypothetical protein